jgi:hypothetical protein
VNLALTAAAVIAGWSGVSAVVLVGWAILRAPSRRARDARCQAAQDELDARRQAIADAMHRHPAGNALRSVDDQIVDSFREEIEAFEAARRASAANS